VPTKSTCSLSSRATSAFRSAQYCGSRYVTLFDPQIVRAFRNPWHYSLDLWKYWTAIKVPILVLRGVHSDLLTAELAQDMIRRNPLASLLEIEGCGHAPPLMSHDQIGPGCEFLQA
jgi:pimeloyl-ACP methyl ester carboxylesterase